MQTSTAIVSAAPINVQVTPTTSGSIVVSWDQQIGNAIWTTVEITEAGSPTFGLSVRKAIVRS